MYLLDVYDEKQLSESIAFLYALLKERTPQQSISHREMPSYADHVEFVMSKPYREWYIIRQLKENYGAIYLTKYREIGVFILNKWQGHGLATDAVCRLIAKHAGPFYANINPANERSLAFFKSLGFEPYQNTLVLDRRSAKLKTK